MALFQNRRDAGKKLAQKLQQFKDKDIIIYGLPRGGIPVAYEVAKDLKAPLDAFIVRKLGVPGQEELAMGAIASGDARVMNNDVLRFLKISDQAVADVINKEKKELERREKLYRGDIPPLNPQNKTVILIDDGLATGASMHAAVKALKEMNPSKIIVAVPISAPETCAEFEEYIDEIICAFTPEAFRGVGQWYYDFSQTTDEEVRELLQSINEETE